MHQDIIKAWEKVKNAKGLSDLSEIIKTQQESCKSLLSTKESLLDEYRIDLKARDDDYVRELKRQAQEIGILFSWVDTLTSRMSTQYKSFQHTLREEISKVEKAFVAERNEILGSNINEIETLLENRRENEKYKTPHY